MPVLKFFVLLLVLSASTALADATEEFNNLLDENWQWQLDQNPVRASFLGDRRNNDKWSNNSIEAIETRQDATREFMRRLLAIDSSQLSDGDRLNYDLFRRDLQNDIEGFRFKTYLMPISQRGGVQTLDAIAESLSPRSVADFEDWLARMATVDQVIEQTIALQEAGREQGYMPPKILMERIPDQVSAQLVEDPMLSPFYKAFEEMPDSISADDQARLREAALSLIDDTIVPAYRDFSR